MWSERIICDRRHAHDRKRRYTLLLVPEFLVMLWGVGAGVTRSADRATALLVRLGVTGARTRSRYPARIDE
jgi:hypothetical protein